VQENKTSPARARLQRSVDRLVYGARGDPYAALADLGRRITGSPGDLLHEVVHAVTDALRARPGTDVLRTQLPFDINAEKSLSGDIGAARREEVPQFSVSISKRKGA